METVNHQKNREFLTAIYRDMSEAERLFKADSQFLHYRSMIGETPFHYVIVESDIEKADKLLGWGADINTQNDFGTTPLMSAVTLGELNVVKWLVQHGANLELKNVNGETALASATSNEKAGLFQFLILLPRKHPIDFYYDDLSAHDVFEDKDLVMRNYLISLGLTERFI
ncbi:MAG TPA: ankyrin repeat domain-containing protein [Verrucomicrobiae bacterium]|jgi:ankyrin repeat protein|nr:ankyrin repeat domain-containing protein [Verrucomicrobiae bacterium]